jgi:hypothetical protein
MLGVGFGWRVEIADGRVELRRPDFADARPGLGATARAQTIVTKGEVGPSKKLCRPARLCPTDGTALQFLANREKNREFSRRGY